MADQLFKNSDTKLSVSAVRNAVTGLAVTNATVTYTIYEALTDAELLLWDRPGGVDIEDLTAVSGASAVSMTYNAANAGTAIDGQYTGTVTKTVGESLTIGDQHPVSFLINDTRVVRLFRVAYNRGENAP